MSCFIGNWLFGDYITYYYIKENGRAGVVGVYEETNSITIMFAAQSASLPEDENEKE